MFQRLCRLSVDELSELIEKDELDTVLDIAGPDRLLPSSKNKETLASFLLATCGLDILANISVRRMLLQTLPLGTLCDLAHRFKIPRNKKVYDLSLAIACLPWKYNSALANTFAVEFNIPPDYLPRKIAREEPIENIDPFEDIPNLMPYQVQVKKKLSWIVQGKARRALVHMPTGSGKTRTVIETIIDSALGRNLLENEGSVLWLAHADELCSQAVDTFRDIWQKKADRTGRLVKFWGSFKPSVEDFGCSFIVASLQKVYSLMENHQDLFEKMRDRVKLVVIDEAHKALAPTYKKVLTSLVEGRETNLVGLSATPGRGLESRKENKELSKLFGSLLIKPIFKGKDAISELRKIGVLSRLKRFVRPSNVSVELSSSEVEYVNSFMDMPSSVLERLGADVNRNKLILSIVREQLLKKNPCLLFSCSVKHARLLSTAINFSGFRAAFVDCYMGRGSRRQIVQKFRSGDIDILINFGVLSTGFDAPRIRTVIITRPTSSVVLYSQMIGRGLRGPLMGGTKVCNLIDIKDNYENFGTINEVYSCFNSYWS